MVKDAHYISMDTNAHRNLRTARDIYEKGLVDENESRDSFVVIDANYILWIIFLNFLWLRIQMETVSLMWM